MILSNNTNTLKISSVHINHAIYNRVGIGIIHESNLPPTLQVVRLRSQVLLGWTRTHLCKIGFLCKLMTVCPCHVRWSSQFGTDYTIIFMYTLLQVSHLGVVLVSSENLVLLHCDDEYSYVVWMRFLSALSYLLNGSSWYTPHITEYIFFLLLNLYFSRRCLAILGLIYSVFG